MSDISIPGVTASKYKTDELIQGLMKIERIPRNREEKELEKYKTQQTAWRDVNRLGTSLRDNAKSLYSFNNPFTEKLGESTNERALSVSASREARDQSFKIKIQQTAATDSFLSGEISTDSKVPAGSYRFGVGEKDIQFNWKGGSYQEFSDALNRRGSGLIRSSLIQIAPKTRSLLIESLKTGESQRLSFKEDAKKFALETGFIKKDDTGAIEISNKDVIAPPSSNTISNFSAAARARDGLVLEYTISWKEAQSETAGEAAQNVGPNTLSPLSLNWKGITIENAPSETAISAKNVPPSVPVSVTDNNVLSLRSTKGTAIPLPSAPESSEKTDFVIDLSEFGDVNSLLIHNRNTDREFTIENIRIRDPKSADGYIPVNPVSVARDARFTYEGISIVRSTNIIDDLVPGVTLTLNEATDTTETINIKPDTEIAKEAIISFVGSYNRLMAELNILTQNKPEIISEIQYFTEEERKSADARLGMMQGDTTLNGIKTNLQRISTSPYPLSDETSLRLLSELGISTKSSTGGGVDSSRLRGYLEIEEKRLDEALKSKMPEIKNLFGYDSDGDLIVDTGVALALDKQMTPYVQTGGIFATRTSALSSRIDTSEKKLTQLDRQLEDKEADLKYKYGRMEGTLNSLQNQSNSISNFNNQNSNNR